MQSYFVILILFFLLCHFHFHKCFFFLLLYKSFKFRDRVRTVVNVLGDCLGAGIVDHISKNDLAAPSINPQPSTANENVSYEIETQKET